MAFTNDQLLEFFRRDMDDEVEPQLWSDDNILDYLDEAQAEFCELVDVLAADITIAYTATDVATAGGYVDIPHEITRVRSAELLGVRKYLILANQEEFEDNPQRFVDNDYGLDARNSEWKDDTGEPRALITDMVSKQVRLYPIPTTDDTISMRVFRKATTSPLDGDDLEVTDNQHLRAILIKARSLAFLKQDSETYEPQESEKLEQIFLRRVAEFSQRVRRSRRRSNVTNYGGIA